MAVTRIDSRQIRNRSALSQITPTANRELDDLLSLINSELISPLRLIASATPDLTLNVEAIKIQNADTSLTRALQPIEYTVPVFTSGSIVFPAASGSNIVVTPGADILLTIASNKYKKVVVLMDSTGNIRLALGSDQNTKADADNEKVITSVGRPIGHYVVRNNAGTIDNVTNANIVQYVGGGGDSFGSQDISMKLIGGGTWAWNLGTTSLSFTADSYIQIPGLPNARNTIQFSTQSPISLNVDGKVAYITVNRDTGATANLTVSVADIAAMTPDANTVVIARRIGNDVYVGRSSFKLIDGESQSLDAGMSDQNMTLLGSSVTEATSLPTYGSRGAPKRTLDDTQGILDAMASMDNELDKFFGQLQIREHSPSNKRVIITGSDKTMKDNTVLSQAVNSLLMQFTGAEIDFVTGNIYASDGTTPLGINFTPFSIPVGDYFWYSVNLVAATVNADNTIGAQLLVIPATASGASAALAPKPAFSKGTKLGLVVIHNTGGVLDNIVQANIKQLGVGSGGSGGAGDTTDLIERMKDWLGDAPFEWMTPNVFATDGDTKIASATAQFNVPNSSYKFASAGLNIISKQNLDDTFLASAFDVGEIELAAYWLAGAIDTSAVYKVSRDGGNEFQTVPMTRIPGTETYRGFYRFVNEATYASLYSQATGAATLDFDATNQKQLAQKFVVASGCQVIKQALLTLTKIGTPDGNYVVRIVKDSAGQPSTDLNDVIGESSIGTMASLITGSNTISVYAVCSAGTYWVVLVPDASYQSTYANGSKEISWDCNASGTGTSSKFNGTAWSSIATNDFKYVIKGRQLDLRVMVESGASNVELAGFGILYNYSQGIASGTFNREVQSFDGITGNLNTFTLTNFLPLADKLEVHWVEKGLVYNYGAFILNGDQVIFPVSTFNETGTQTLIFKQPEGSGFDNSDQNASLLAANHLGSPDATIDRSAAGQGIFLRRPDGTLREIAINDSDELVVYSV